MGVTIMQVMSRLYQVLDHSRRRFVLQWFSFYEYLFLISFDEEDVGINMSTVDDDYYWPKQLEG